MDTPNRNIPPTPCSSPIDLHLELELNLEPEKMRQHPTRIRSVSTSPTRSTSTTKRNALRDKKREENCRFELFIHEPSWRETSSHVRIEDIAKSCPS